MNDHDTEQIIKMIYVLFQNVKVGVRASEQYMNVLHNSSFYQDLSVEELATFMHVLAAIDVMNHNLEQLMNFLETNVPDIATATLRNLYGLTDGSSRN